MRQTFPISICLNAQQSEPLYISISLKLSSTEWQIAGIVTDVVLNVVKQRCTMRGGTKTLSNMRSVLVSNLFCFRVTAAIILGLPWLWSYHRIVSCIVKSSNCHHCAKCQQSACQQIDLSLDNKDHVTYDCYQKHYIKTYVYHAYICLYYNVLHNN